MRPALRMSLEPQEAAPSSDSVAHCQAWCILSLHGPGHSCQPSCHPPSRRQHPEAAVGPPKHRHICAILKGPRWRGPLPPAKGWTQDPLHASRTPLPGMPTPELSDPAAKHLGGALAPLPLPTWLPAHPRPFHHWLKFLHCGKVSLRFTIFKCAAQWHQGHSRCL